MFKKFIKSLLFKSENQNLDDEYSKRVVLIRENILNFLKKKGDGYSSLLISEGGNWNFTENGSRITIALPQVNMYIRVHSYLSKGFTSLELLGIERSDWEKYQKEAAALRLAMQGLSNNLTFIEFFWDESIDYNSVVLKLQGIVK